MGSIERRDHQRLKPAVSCTWPEGKETGHQPPIADDLYSSIFRFPTIWSISSRSAAELQYHDDKPSIITGED
ncbi:hypothetical protein LIA77_09706 [Sarocladium implicatum]|nr:hypothetical protein LIA77_09706 [Sarocladium implicatum]